MVETEGVVVIRSLEHLRELARAASPHRLFCELSLAAGRRKHLKVIWLGGVRRDTLMTRTPFGYSTSVARTFLPTFIERGQLSLAPQRSVEEKSHG